MTAGATTAGRAFDAITARGEAWARRHDLALDHRGWLVDVDANFFRPLTAETRGELLASGELDGTGSSGRIAAPHSSSALAVNVFDPWRGADAAPLMAALGLPVTLRVSGFERSFATGLAGNSPTVDVVLEAESEPVVAVEVKHREPYGQVRNPFAASYFADPGLWEGCRPLGDLARSIAVGTDAFRHLHVAQLIKHALGLTRQEGPGGFVLFYLWHDEPGREASAHRKELDRFEKVAADCIDFRSATLWEVVSGVDVGPECVSGWRAYLHDRYVFG